MKKKPLILIVIILSLLSRLTFSAEEGCIEGDCAVPKEVYDEICQDVINEEIRITCNVSPSNLVWVDLNLDGEDEIIVDGNMISIFYAGSGGYTSFLFQKKGEKYILINEFFGRAIAVTGNKTNGYFDLSQEYKHYYGHNDEQEGWVLNKRLYKFDKTKEKYTSSDEGPPNAAVNDYSTKNARLIINTFQKYIYSKIAYSESDLKTMKVEFVEYYNEEVKPRLQNISQNLSSSAIHWVDLDWDVVPELLFWTEGLAPTDWGAKEMFFIVKVPEKGEPEIIESFYLDPEPSRQVRKYKHILFWADPNKNKGYNGFVRAVFSYGAFGASGSSFFNYEIGWNKYEEKVYVKKFVTAFPISVDLENDQETKKADRGASLSPGTGVATPRTGSTGIDIYEDSVFVSVNGKVTYGDKMRFRIPRGACNIVEQLFTFYTIADKKSIDQLEGAVVPIELNGEKIYAEVLYVAPFFSGQRVLFTLGSYDIKEHIKYYENTDSLRINILSNDGSLENFKAEDFFDVLHNEWDMTNFANSMNEAKAKCLALD